MAADNIEESSAAQPASSPAIAALFDEGGAIQGVLPGYRPRAGQIEMAQQVQAAVESGGLSVLEAGTGIGKTFAYLVPIIASGKSALISTGSRALQDQLSQRDVPLVAQALGVTVSLAVLKGRANYICRQALAAGGQRGGELFGEEEGDWQKIVDFSARSEDGDIAGLSGVSSKSGLLRAAVSTPESCNTRSCDYYKECFLYKARARAHRADIVIVNHHLFLSDLRLREESIAELLPSRDVVLFDEAHRLPELAPEFLGEKFSSGQLLRYLKLAERLCAEYAADAEPVFAAARSVKNGLERLLGLSAPLLDRQRKTASALAGGEWAAALADLQRRLVSLATMLQDRAAEDERIEKLAQRALNDKRVLAAWLADDVVAPPPAADEAPDSAKADDEEPLVRWADYSSSGNLTLYAVPMTGRHFLARQWRQLETVIFTSATLSVGGAFDDFCEAAGIEHTAAHSWPSPYDFPNHSLLYLPRRLPSPNEAGHAEAVADAALPLILANAGRAFLLFSSWRALEAANERLRQPLQAAAIEVLKQGEQPNDKLLARFRRHERAVLIGSRLFWEGVDVRGPALSLLVVDKIPFVPPDDPLLVARDEWRKKRDENPFLRNQLPAAVLLMKQVAGRLIRDYDDYGIFVIGDPRVLNKGYGRTILEALPPMRRCHDEAQAVKFLSR